ADSQPPGRFHYPAETSLNSIAWRRPRRSGPFVTRPPASSGWFTSNLPSEESNWIAVRSPVCAASSALANTVMLFSSSIVNGPYVLFPLPASRPARCHIDRSVAHTKQVHSGSRRDSYGNEAILPGN